MQNEQEQLACIMECLGVPDKVRRGAAPARSTERPQYLIDRASRRKLFFDSTGAPRPVVNSKGRRRRPASKSLAQVLKCDDDLFVDFIAKCLIYDPDRRCARSLPSACPAIEALVQAQGAGRPPASLLQARIALGGAGLGRPPRARSPALPHERRPEHRRHLDPATKAADLDARVVVGL
jgi:hypothetical protein